VDSFTIIGLVLASGGALFLFCLGVALVASIVGRVEMERRKSEAVEQERRHKERLRALELGFPLPEAEVARAEAESKRAQAAGTVGLVVPLGLGGIAVGVTAIILDHQVQMPGILYVIWGVCGLVSLVTAVMCMVTLRRGTSAKPGRPTPPRTEDSELLSSSR